MIPPTGRAIDLSLPIRDGAPSFPGDPTCVIRPWATIGPDLANLHQVTLGTHQGTHLDAPLHFLADGAPIDQVPLEALVGQAILLDLRHKAPRSTITVEDLADVVVAPGDRLVLRMGWDRVLTDDPVAYFRDVPRLGKEAARWLATKHLAVVGMDTPTPNPDAFVEVHQALLGVGTVLVEALANLDALHEGSFWLSAVPLRLEGLDGSPVRAFGVQALREG
jgi:kynurenine formamidase